MQQYPCLSVLLSVTSGDVDVGGLLHLNYKGVARWEAALHIESNCVLQARSWPHDHHKCDVSLSLSTALAGSGHSVYLLSNPSHQVSGNLPYISNITDKRTTLNARFLECDQGRLLCTSSFGP